MILTMATLETGPSELHGTKLVEQRTLYAALTVLADCAKILLYYTGTR